MGTLWGKLAGDTSRLALEISFATDPDEGEAATKEMSASWGELKIWVNGTNLCRHVEGNASLESVNWYLLPFLEWVVENWNPLFHEERLPLRNAAPDAWSALEQTWSDWMRVGDNDEDATARAWGGWRRRHCARAAREGGLFPDIVFRRWRDLVEISWGPSPLAGIPEDVRFLAPKGVERVDPRLVTDAFYDVISNASLDLMKRCPGSGRLRHLKRSVKRLNEASTESRLVWLAGLGTDADSVRNGWKRVTRWVENRFGSTHTEGLFAVEKTPLVIHGSCDAALMFGAVAPTVESDDALNLAGAMLELWTKKPSDVRPSELVKDEPISADLGRAWEQGYDLARAFLDEVTAAARGDGWVDVEKLVKGLGITVKEIVLQDSKIRGVSVVGRSSRPGILLNSNNAFNQKSEGRRFTIAHELCHILYDRQSGRRLAIASGPWAPRDVEQRANAFAAMLLMPPDLVSVAAEKTTKLESVEGVAQVASMLHTSFLATLSHLRNLGYIDEETETSLHEEVLVSPAVSSADAQPEPGQPVRRISFDEG